MAKAYRVADLYRDHGEALRLELHGPDDGMARTIRVPEAQRPGLGLTGYLRSYAQKRILIFGRVEFLFLQDLEDEEERESRLSAILTKLTPAVIVARRYRPPRSLVKHCRQLGMPLFRSEMKTANLLSKVNVLLSDEFAPSVTRHGCLAEVYGVGVMLEGDSSVGKSEAALGLIERGHRLIADDIVKIRKREAHYLEGSGVELTRHHMEIRGIGIVNVASLFGAVCVRDSKRVDIVVHLEEWNEGRFYDRVGLEDKFCDILGVKIPYNILPVKPGRDVVLLIETIALNYRLRRMGCNAAKELNAKLIATISRKR